jgi:hypothetical protein
VLKGRPVRQTIGRYFAAFRKSQRKTMADLTLGLLRSGKTGEAHIARGMVDATTPRHRIKRIWRFCKNARICPEQAMRCLIQWLVPVGCPVTVALDWTYLTDYVMLSANVVVAGRAVPLAWTVMKRRVFDATKNSRNTVEDDLILRLDAAMGEREWLLVADRGYARADLIAKLQGWGIRFVIRAQTGTWAQMEGFSDRLENLACRPNRAVRYEGVRYQKQRQVEVSLVTTHRDPAAEAWYLLTNVDEDAETICRLYAERMSIEQAFRDGKSNLRIDKLWLAAAERMERMMIIVALAMAMAILTGLKWRRENYGKDPQLTTKRKGQSLSVFRLGQHLIQLCGLPPGLEHEPLFIVLEPT